MRYSLKKLDKIKDWGKMISRARTQNDEVPNYRFMEALPFVLLAGFLLGVIYPIQIIVDIWPFIGVFIACGLSLSYMSTSFFQMMSIGFTSSLHHTTVSTLQPWGVVKVITNKKDQVDQELGEEFEQHIFRLHGLSFPLPMGGGGKYGYYIIPAGGYAVRGGSIQIFNDPVRWAYSELPQVLREKIKEDPKYHLGDPIWWCVLSPNTTKEIVKSFDFSTAGESISDIISMSKLSHEGAFLNEQARRMSVSLFRNVVNAVPQRRRRFQQQQPPQESVSYKEEEQ
jgi:hypothetical protein